MSTRYNTQNPIESDDVRDMSDNAKNLDLFSNSSELSFYDRLGIGRKTIHGMNSEFDGMIVGINSEFDAQILNMGFSRVGTFLSGATLTNSRQTLLWDTANGGDGQEYGWSGAFPKVVPPSSTPISTGGIAVGAWMSRFDPELRIMVREALRRSYAEAGYNVVGTFQAGFTIVNANDVGIDETTGKGFTGQAGEVAAGTDPASGGFVDVSQLLTRVITTVSSVNSGIFRVGQLVTLTDRALATFKVVSGGTADGLGVLDAGGGNTAILIHNGAVFVEWFGAKNDGSVASAAFQAALNSANTVYAQNGPYKIGGVDIPLGKSLVGGVGFHTDKTKGAVLIPAAGAQYMVQVGVGCNFSGFLMYEPDQFFAFTSNYLNENFITTAVPILVNVCGDSTISDMVVVGFNHIIKRVDISSTGGVASCTFKHIRCFPTASGIDVNRSLDIFKLEDIHMNPSIFNRVYGANTTSQYMMTKLALSVSAFRFGRVDDCQMVDCFAYGVKQFIEVYRDAYTGDNNSGTGLTATNCSADVCSQFFFLNRSDSPFGYKFNNCWAVPIVKPLDNSPQGSVVVGDAVTLIEANEIYLSNFNQFGKPTVPQIVPIHLKKADNLLCFAANSRYNQAFFSNVSAIELDGPAYMNNGTTTGSLRNTYHGDEIVPVTPGDLKLKNANGNTALSFENNAINTYGIHNNYSQVLKEGIASGTFTIEQGAGANVNVTSVSFASLAMFTKVGGVVTVNGLLTVTPTASGADTRVFMKPPIAFSTGAGYGAGGIIGKTNAASIEKSGGDMRLSFTSESTGSHFVAFTYSYLIT